MPKKTNKLPSQKKLKEDFRYNPTTGSFLRYDDNFGWLKQGYWYTKYEGQQYMAHRLIWKWWYGYDPEEIDHINKDRSDNRIDNLRNVNTKTNCRNQTKARNNTSGFNGVSYLARLEKYQAYVRIDYKQIYIGIYNTPQEASKARKEFLREFYPEVFSESHGE